MVSILQVHGELPDAACSGATCTHANSETTTEYPSIPTNNLMNGILGLWHLNETPVSTASGYYKDDSGYGHHATLSSSINVKSIPGMFNNGLEVSDFGRVLTVPHVSTLNPSNTMTVAFWIRSFGVKNTFSPIICKTDFNRGWSIDYPNTDPAASAIRVRIDTSAGNNQVAVLSANFIGDQKWHHIVMTLSSGSGAFYVDGRPDNTFSYSHGAGFGSTSTFYVLSDNFYNSNADEVAIWGRVLSANEIKHLYQRGASRVKYQVRTCNDGACVGESWQGPDGTSGTFFSELNNNTIPATGMGSVNKMTPAISMAPANNQFFQYRAILESSSSTVSFFPELKSTTVDPVHYDASSPTIYGKDSINFSVLDTFTETLGSEGCSDGVTYNLSLDKTIWKYWNGSAWATSNGLKAQSNSAAVVSANRLTFPTQVGRGPLYIKAYLNSTGSSKCELDNLHLDGRK
jgi:Concanavalin A-like lectin/glucanases superfamily